MPTASSPRPSSYMPVPAYRAGEPLLERVTRFVEQNQIASMAGAFALGVLLGTLARR